ncbi:MAG: peptidoglycan endopeptidase, partial [Polaromonas sp.]|nr:peptidoglycan endopeptidase [Polaromonas sp.]
RRAFSHVGIYVGEGKFIHSPKPGAEVRVESMGVSYWQKRFDGARRVAGARPAPGSAASDTLQVAAPSTSARQLSPTELQAAQAVQFQLLAQ